MPDAGYRVTGRVQGVGFRWWTRSLAARVGVTGTVRNLADGAVVVHARGTEEQMMELRARLGEGPPLARVDRVEEIGFSADGWSEGEFVVLK